MSLLLVTNDFPPKVGGIQSYLWELWRRLPPEEVTVLTTSYQGDRTFDAAQAFQVVRVPWRVLLPTPGLVRRIDALARHVGAGEVVLDPVLPLGLVGPFLDRPYAVVLHGAEVTVPGRLPLAAAVLRRVLKRAAHVVAGGGYVSAEADRAAGRRLPTTVVPPGVDPVAFHPLTDGERQAVRRRFGLRSGGPLVVSVSRLVPRKGMDTLIRAAALLAPSRPDLEVVIVGDGRDRTRLERLVTTTGAPVRFLGRVAAEDLAAVHGAADVFAMLCRNRWAGLEQEGFGIVFLEAAACGVPSVAGDSGGVAEAVLDGETGVVVRQPADPGAAAEAIAGLLDHPERRRRMGEAARRRIEEELGYDHLASRLHHALTALR